jgi:outer membrane protein assembly factor BamB
VLALGPQARAGSTEPSQPLPAEVRWTLVVSAPPAASPTVSESHVYIALKSGVVTAHRINDGAVAWQQPIRTDFPIEVADDRLFVASGEAVLALDPKDGRTLWTAPAGVVTAPLLAQNGWVIAAVKGELLAFRSADGSRVWQRPSGEQIRRASVEGDRLYVPLNDRLLALTLATGVTEWEVRFAGEPTEVLAFVDRVYVGSVDKKFYCLKAPTGEVDWVYTVGSAVRGKPTADAAHVYITAIDNMVRAFDRKNGARRWQKDARFRPTIGPFVVGSAVIVAGRAAVVRAFQSNTGAELPSLTLSKVVVMPPGFGFSRGDAVIAAVMGDLSEQWNLTLLGPPLWTSPAIVPLTVLPGEVVEMRPPGG